MKKLLTITALIMLTAAASAQYINRDSWFTITGQAAIGKTNGVKAPAGAWLEVGKDSTNKGLIMPRVLDTSLIPSPTRGMICYQLPDKRFYYHDGFYWNLIPREGKVAQMIHDSIPDFGALYPLVVINNILQLDSTWLANVGIGGGGGGGGITALSLDVTGSGVGIVPATVVGIRGQGIPLLSAGNLRFDGSAWMFDNTAYLSTSAAAALYQPIGTYLTTISGIAAGGDLSGTYPNPTVTGIRGNAIPSLSTGYLRWNGSAFVFDNSTFLTGNQTITLSGDVTGSGATAITSTLATVNGTVGTFGSSTLIPILTVNGKGLVTNVSTVSVVGGVSSVFGRTGAVVATAGDYNYAQITRTKQVHAAGATVTVATATDWLIVKPALATLAITLTAAPVDGQRVDISFKLAVTTLTVNPNSGQTIKDANGATSVEAGESIAYQYDATDLIWYRL